ncbi:MAG: cyclic nucleotide-binding domain-containing protein [Candidatus Komeilibacteria bacterium]|nr:cyclic nucleotide-binding domain-containing protein [Candidatus Komeilibacteria bacterium]
MYRSHTHLNECARIPLFSSLKKNQLAQLADAAFERTCTDGIAIYRHEAPLTSVCAVIEGSLEKYIDIGDITVSVGSIQRHSVWGLEALTQPGIRFQHSIRSGIDGARLLEWPVRDFMRLCANDSDMRARILVALSSQQERVIRSLEESLALALAIQPIVNSPDLSLQDKYEMLLAFTAEVCRASCACIAHFEPHQNLIRIEAAQGYRDMTRGSRLSLRGDTLLSRMYTASSALYISPATYERQYAMARYSRQHMALVPLRLNDDDTGALVMADDAHPMGSDVVALMQVAAMGIRLVSLASHEERSKAYTEYVSRVYIGLL